MHPAAAVRAVQAEAGDGDVEGFAGGASGPWRDLRQLWMSSHAAEGAFGVVEQLGYALGHKELAELAHKLVNEKHRGTLLIQEIVLEMAAVAVLALWLAERACATT